MIATWQSIFPKLFTSVSLAPKQLVEHFRYPEDLFRVQTNTYGRYQFSDATMFFNRNAAWSVAQAPAIEPEGLTGAVSGGLVNDLNSVNTGDVRDASVARFEPYYTMFHAPGSAQKQACFQCCVRLCRFLLTTPEKNYARSWSFRASLRHTGN